MTVHVSMFWVQHFLYQIKWPQFSQLSWRGIWPINFAPFLCKMEVFPAFFVACHKVKRNLDRRFFSNFQIKNNYIWPTDISTKIPWTLSQQVSLLKIFAKNMVLAVSASWLLPLGLRLLSQANWKGIDKILYQTEYISHITSLRQGLLETHMYAI